MFHGKVVIFWAIMKPFQLGVKKKKSATWTRMQCGLMENESYQKIKLSRKSAELNRNVMRTRKMSQWLLRSVPAEARGGRRLPSCVQPGGDGLRSRYEIHVHWAQVKKIKTRLVSFSTYHNCHHRMARPIQKVSCQVRLPFLYLTHTRDALYYRTPTWTRIPFWRKFKAPFGRDNTVD